MLVELMVPTVMFGVPEKFVAVAALPEHELEVDAFPVHEPELPEQLPANWPVNVAAHMFRNLPPVPVPMLYVSVAAGT